MDERREKIAEIIQGDLGMPNKRLALERADKILALLSPQWISIADELPEEEGEYLCYWNTLGNICRKVLYFRLYNKSFVDPDFDRVEFRQPNKWQPLP